MQDRRQNNESAGPDFGGVGGPTMVGLDESE